MADDEAPKPLRLRCPDCGSSLLIDRSTGEVLAHRPPKAPPGGGRDFDSLRRDLDTRKAEAEDLFSRELDAMKDRDRLLEKKFEEAMKRAEEEPDDEPPPRPWDLD